eukprot:Trichotokara_eunicae@DN3432_c0_g1_i2.p1
MKDLSINKKHKPNGPLGVQLGRAVRLAGPQWKDAVWISASIHDALPAKGKKSTSGESNTGGVLIEAIESEGLADAFSFSSPLKGDKINQLTKKHLGSQVHNSKIVDALVDWQIEKRGKGAEAEAEKFVDNFIQTLK